VQALAELDANPQDVFALHNRAWAELQLGLPAQAATSFEQVLSMGLPWRFLWYDYSLFEAYISVGRYQEVLNLGLDILTYAPGVEEVHYYVGRAYEGLGDSKRAQGRYEMALALNRHFSLAQVALSHLLAS
jgi:tetratricopeptide (TPR) repeat protein